MSNETTTVDFDAAGYDDRRKGWGLHSVADRYDYATPDERSRWQRGWWSAEWEMFNARVKERIANG